MASRRGLSAGATLEPTQVHRTVVAALQQEDADQVVATVAVTEVAPNPDNPERRSIVDIDELAASIGEVGVLSPLLVVPAREWLSHHPAHLEQVGPARWVCLAGHRRLAAARQAGVEVVPAVARHDLASVDSVVLHENLQRVALTPLEEAAAYARLVERGMSQRSIAAHLGVAQGQVSKRLRLLALPDAFQARLIAGELQIGDALALLEDPGPDALADLAAASADLLPEPGQQVRVWWVQQAARQRLHQRRQEAARAAAAAAAAAEGLEAVEDQPNRTPLKTTKAIDAARRAGTLVVHGRTGPDDEPVVDYYDRSATRPAAARDPQHDDERHAAKARKLRWPALVEAASTTPKRDDLRSALLAHTLSGHKIDSLSGTLAQKLVAEAGGGPVSSDYYGHWLDATVADLRSEARREHLAWILVLACAEQAVRSKGTHVPWDAQDLWYTDQLSLRSPGWHPTEWEQGRAAAARTQRAGEHPEPEEHHDGGGVA